MTLMVLLCLLFLAVFDDSDNRAFYLFLAFVLVMFR